MKKLYPVLLMTALILGSCTTNEDYNALDTPAFELTEKFVEGKSTTETCALTDLIAGQHTDVGTLYVLADSDNLYITYRTEEGWTLSETQLFIGEETNIPLTNPGNPKVGNFPYKGVHASNVNEVTYTIPLDAVNDCFTAAAHAVVNNISGDSETAWSAGADLIGSNWATVTDFCKTGCTINDDGNDDLPVRIR